MNSVQANATATPDAVRGWVDHLPPRLAAYARLARFDRPAGAWLLYLPCLWGLGLSGGLAAKPEWIVLFGLGAFVMRAAGCVWNDVLDRDLDSKVERTRSRPIPSGAVSVGAALAWMVALALMGFGVWLCLGALARWWALGSLGLVAAYPLMKRITWWPQAWLGLTFNWGTLVGYAEGASHVDVVAGLVWAAGIAWTLGYDTIYALQDIEDDALAGVKSSARALGSGVRAGVGAFYLLSAVLLGAAMALAVGLWWAAAGVLPYAAHLAWQWARLRPGDTASALTLFRSNRSAGLLAALGCAAVGLA
ncbi:MAG: 4-hydroxybenzoate octaprenyltransferase [Sphingomonadaceae bacterium]|nr:4-hydroxybenzoate octaprenyltransferase [Sphingomonadaceae bacterium]